ncbi:hypothetical protein IFM89_025903 [Coptis chinensis]|uniref:Uncharacterized protein n=1 Tax=Coptis chinensis TaxID=261450 RepID=A0A835HT93_9MAGN|nr:hypothetical protein IFM89_025903 [Coptis chinensis]
MMIRLSFSYRKVKGKDITEVIASEGKKLASAFFGGGGAAIAVARATGATKTSSFLQRKKRRLKRQRCPTMTWDLVSLIEGFVTTHPL